MLKLPMHEEVEQYKKSCEKCLEKSLMKENVQHWEEMIRQCERLLELYRERKMSWTDWEKMKEIAELNRYERKVGIEM